MNDLINNCNISILGGVNNERNFSNECNFTYKSSNKNKKEIAFMKDYWL